MTDQLALEAPGTVLDQHQDLDVERSAEMVAAETAAAHRAPRCRCWPHNIPDGDQCAMCGRPIR